MISDVSSVHQTLTAMATILRQINARIVKKMQFVLEVIKLLQNQAIQKRNCQNLNNVLI